MRIDLKHVPAHGHITDDVLLFSETQSRFVVTVSPENAAAFEQCLASHACACAGKVTDDSRFTIHGTAGSVVIQAAIAELKEAWQAPLRW